MLKGAVCESGVFSVRAGPQILFYGERKSPTTVTFGIALKELVVLEEIDMLTKVNGG